MIKECTNRLEWPLVASRFIIWPLRRFRCWYDFVSLRWSNPELALELPPLFPIPAWFILFGFPGPARCKKGDTEPKRLRINMGNCSITVESSATVLVPAPDINADKDRSESFRS